MEITDFEFLTPFLPRWDIGDGAEYRLNEPFSFAYLRDGELVTRTGPTWHLCPDFRFDGASVPEKLQWLIHNVGRHLGAALAHDLAYWLGRHQWPGWEDMSREEADRLFLAALKVTPRLSWIQAEAMFEAVRAFGTTVWDDGTDWGTDVPDTDPERPMDLG